MKVDMAHLREQGINIMVFGCDASSSMDADRADLLRDLTIRARRSGFAVDKAALAYVNCGRPEYYGTPDLVQFLASSPGPIPWTHTIDV